MHECMQELTVIKLCDCSAVAEHLSGVSWDVAHCLTPVLSAIVVKVGGVYELEVGCKVCLEKHIFLETLPGIRACKYVCSRSDICKRTITVACLPCYGGLRCKWIILVAAFKGNDLPLHPSHSKVYLLGVFFNDVGIKILWML